MANKALINGKLTDEISFLDRGLQYGDGLFETIAICENEPLCLDAHLARLEDGCEKLNLPKPDYALLKDEISTLIDSIEHAVVKVIVTRGQGGRGYALPEQIKPSRVVTLYPWPEYPKENTSTGVNTRVCQYRYAHNSVLAGIKHLNRLEQILARSEWSDNTIMEGIVMDQHDNVIEGTMSNLFYVKDNVLFTSDLSTCGVEGVIRKKIIALASEQQIELNIQEISLESLLVADEVFLCNSLIGVWPVKMIDKHSFLPGELTRKIQVLLQEQHAIAKLC